MPDKEKVIKGLEMCQYSSKLHCDGCPYCYEGLCETNDCTADLASDALSLLKKQEAVEPKQVDLYGKEEWYGFVCRCPDCKALWMTGKANTHFCPNCGQAVKWDGSDRKTLV